MDRAACSGGEQVEGHEDGSEQPPAVVSKAVLQQRAQIIFSGKTGAVVASGEVEATSDPSLLLISDVIDVVDALPDVANAAHANAAQESAAAPRSAHLVGVRAMCALLSAHSVRPSVPSAPSRSLR